MIARGTGYVKGPKASARLTAHLKYIEHRPDGREPQPGRESRALFGKGDDHVSRADAREEIMSHTDRGVAYHKLVLSPSDTEAACIGNWQQWTRDVMRDLEERKGVELHWYAVKHDNTDNPHVHVIIAGRGETEGGGERQVRMDRSDYDGLRELGREHSGIEQAEMIHEAAHDFGEMLHEEVGQHVGHENADQHMELPDF